MMVFKKFSDIEEQLPVDEYIRTTTDVSTHTSLPSRVVKTMCDSWRAVREASVVSRSVLVYYYYFYHYLDAADICAFAI